MNDLAGAANSDGKNARQLVPIGEPMPMLRDPYARLALYGSGGIVDEAGSPGINFLEYWRIFYKRKWLILGITAASVVLGAVWTLMQAPSYTSTVRLQIDPPSKLVEGNRVSEEFSDYEFKQTQYELLRSGTIAERVASALNLEKGSVGGISVKPVSDSRLVDLSYTGNESSKAQRIANAYADAFIALNIDKRFQANESAKVFLEDKIQQLKQRLEESEQALVEFARKQQIVATDIAEKSSIAESALAAATTELSALISERTKNEGLWRQAVGANVLSLPQFLMDPALAALRTQRSELEIQYQENLKTFKSDYPLMVQIQGKIDEIDRQLAGQAQTIKDSLKGGYEASVARENELKARVEVLKTELLDLQKRSIQYNILKREVDTNRELYTSLLQRYKEVDVAGGAGSNNVFVVDRASPGRASATSLAQALLKALVLGLFIGVVLAYALEKLDDKIHTAEQLEEITGLTPLGIIPKTSNIALESSDPRSAVGEAYRSLCTALQFTTDSGVPRSLMITSAGPGEGKSSAALAIARHFANLGRKVLLIDADLRKPSLHVKIGRDNAIGLSNCLTGSCTPPEAMQKTEMDTLAFMASGPLPPNAADLLGSARLVSLLSIGTEIFDLIIVDGPPVLGLADSLILSSAASGTLLVVGAGVTRKGHIRGALRRLQLSRGHVIGAVLSSYDAKAVGYGADYAYGYDYHYRSQTQPSGLSIGGVIRSLARPQHSDVHENA